MKGQVKFKLGATEYTMAIEGNDDRETLLDMAVLGNPPRYCHECKNDQYFTLDANKDKESNIYVNVRCSKCGAKAKLGLYKSGGYFWHKFKAWGTPEEIPTRDVNSDVQETTVQEPF